MKLTGDVPDFLAIPLLESLGYELTVIDQNDKYLFFTQNDPPIFERTEEILRTDVMSCHPESSRDEITELLDGMKSGKIDSVVIPATKDGKDIHVEYRAIRDSEGKYYGCMELVKHI